MTCQHFLFIAAGFLALSPNGFAQPQEDEKAETDMVYLQMTADTFIALGSLEDVLGIRDCLIKYCHVLITATGYPKMNFKCENAYSSGKMTIPELKEVKARLKPGCKILIDKIQLRKKTPKSECASLPDTEVVIIESGQ